jgi:hypothetical protein
MERNDDDDERHREQYGTIGMNVHPSVSEINNVPPVPVYIKVM